MRSRQRDILRLGVLLAFVLVGVVAVSCSSDADNDGDDPLAAMDVDDTECGPAFVDFVSVAEADGGGFVAVARGHYPSACDELGRIEQVVDGESIVVTMCSTQPEGQACAQMLTPFTEMLPLDTDGLEPGTYTVSVNDRSENADREAATLTIE